jgi:hypothetical protein
MQIIILLFKLIFWIIFFILAMPLFLLAALALIQSI